ncbi:MAG: adenosyl-hopene transferase HpnH [Desulfobacteraceae bacterium]|nr:adenosyl-hopene transferase HpnH [Desulfobacteraceae bacterium]
MSIPAIQKARIGAYITRQKLTGNGRFPLVLMLEPLFRCNLRCKGCGKIAYPSEVLSKQLSVNDCAVAVDECGVPVVSIAGGEPLLHPDIQLITRELTARKKFVYLCTNALLLEERLGDFEPSPYLTFNIHLDGLQEFHDARVNRKGTFQRAVTAIRLLVSNGFRVTTNTTLFDGEPPENAARLLDFLSSLEVEGMTISPGFCYATASDQGHFLGRNGTKTLFRNLFLLGRNRNWRFNHSSLYLDFLAGNQDYECLPWGNPTYNVFGWQSPCYLLNDGYATTYKELMEMTDWTRYGVGKDPRCANCMIHSGFEPAAVMDSVKNPLKAIMARLRGSF